MKRIGFILLLFTSSVGFAQKYAVKTNLAYWATTTLNGLKKYRYDGWGVGGGFSYGYQWIIGKHWNLETELGIGYAYLKYDKYLRNRCGRFIDTGHRNYWGPTKLSISFMYLFKSRQK